MLKVILVVLVSACWCSADYIQHIHYVDRINNNLLFRGGEPKNTSDIFAYEQLVQTMKNASTTAGVAFPDPPFLLYDVNLLNPSASGDLLDIKLEKQWFNDNPDKGSFFQFAILGELNSPNAYHGTTLNKKAKGFAEWSTDKLPAFVETIRLMLSLESPIPVVIYFHCECGCDRTGEVAGSYYMRYMNYTFAQAHNFNKLVAGREMLEKPKQAFMWYCQYLKFALNYNLTCHHSDP